MSRLTSAPWIVASLALAACGAKTGLRVPDVPPVDAPDVPDVPDVPVMDACGEPMGCTPPRVECSAAVSTTAGVRASLRATATVDARSRIVSEVWAITASPPGANAALSTMTGLTTDFTGDSAGGYVVRFTATDGAGRSASCNVPITVAPTYRGTEFWAVSTVNSELLGGDVFHFAVAVGNSNDAPVSVTVTGGALASPLTFTVPARSAVTRTLPWVTALSHNLSRLTGNLTDCCDLQCCAMTRQCQAIDGEVPGSSLVARGAYRLVSTAPVSMYQFNPLEFTSDRLCASGTNSYTNDASLLLPTPALTGNYLVLGHNAWATKGAFVAIAAAREGTTSVEVTTRAPIAAGTGVSFAPAGTTRTFTLGQGDVLQLVSDDARTTTGNTFQFEDFTGTVIRASGPVAVFSGVDCSNMSFPDGTLAACDHLEQQMFPLETWGRGAVVSQLQDRSTSEAYMVRILSSADGNQLTFTPSVHAPVTLARGNFVEFEARRDFEVTATAPVLVGQFMEGQQTTPGANVGDPAFVLEVPAAQYRREYTFVVPATYTASFLHVVTRGRVGYRLDGQTRFATATEVAGTPWVVYRQRIDPGSHRVESLNGEALGLKVIGVAAYTSYAYPGGLDLQSVRP